MTGRHYSTAVRLRLLREGELVELLSPPVIDEASGVVRAEIRARLDGVSGFVTYGGLEPHRADGGNLRSSETDDCDEESLRDGNGETLRAAVNANQEPSTTQLGDTTGVRSRIRNRPHSYS